MSDKAFLQVINKDETATICYLRELLYYLSLGIIPRKYVDSNSNNDLRSYSIESLSKDQNYEAMLQAFHNFHKEWVTIVDRELMDRFKIAYNPFLSDEYKYLDASCYEYLKLDWKKRDRKQYLVELKNKLGISLNFKSKSNLNFVNTSLHKFNLTRDFIVKADEYEEELEDHLKPLKKDIVRAIVAGKLDLYKLDQNSGKLSKMSKDDLDEFDMDYRYWEFRDEYIVKLEDAINLFKVNNRDIKHYEISINSSQLILERDHIDIRRKGGKNSYGNYAKLREKTCELAFQYMQMKNYRSGLQLTRDVAETIKKEFKHLLKDFQPYQNYKRGDGNDWTQKTFYKWCNDVFKGLKNNFLHLKL